MRADLFDEIVQKIQYDIEKIEKALGSKEDNEIRLSNNFSELLSLHDENI